MIKNDKNKISTLNKKMDLTWNLIKNELLEVENSTNKGDLDLTRDTRKLLKFKQIVIMKFYEFITSNVKTTHNARFELFYKYICSLKYTYYDIDNFTEEYIHQLISVMNGIKANFKDNFENISIAIDMFELLVLNCEDVEFIKELINALGHDYVDI